MSDFCQECGKPVIAGTTFCDDCLALDYEFDDSEYDNPVEPKGYFIDGYWMGTTEYEDDDSSEDDDGTQI